MRNAVSLFLLALLLAGPAGAATFDRVTDRDLLDRAELVIVATVMESTVRELPDGAIYTDTRLAVEDVLKGRAGETVTVSQLGGFVGDRGIAVPGSPTYEIGSRVITFLEKRKDGGYVTSFMGLGKYEITKSGDLEVAYRDGESIELIEGEASDARIASEFIEAIRAGEPARATRVSQPAAQARSLKPISNGLAASYAATATNASITNPYRWNCPSAPCNKTWRVDDTPQPGVDFITGLANATELWTDEPFAFISLSLSGSHSNNTNVSGTDSDVVLAGTSAHPDCAGGIACAIATLSGTHTYDGDTWWTIVGADVVIESSVNTQALFEVVAAHEFGHAIGIRHSNESGRSPNSNNALMRSVIPSGLSLRTWDREAVSLIYGNGLPCQSVVINSTSGGGTVNSGSTRNLSVNVSGTGPFTYQWYEGTSGNTSNPVGGNSSSFTTPPITVQKQYWVRVSNACPSSADSQTITVTPQTSTCNAPNIVTQPQSQQIAPGGTATLNVAATGDTPLAYKWFQGAVGDTTNQVGTGQTFVTPPLAATTTYWAQVVNPCATANSALATITVATQCVPPAITGQPANVNLLVGQGVSFNVSASGSGPFSYQWYQGEAPSEAQPIAGANTASYAAGPFNTAGTFRFWVKVTNGCGSANSITIVVSVSCSEASVPEIAAPAAAFFSLPYDVSWTGDLGLTPTFELQEATNASFTANVRTFTVSGAKKHTIPAHTEIAVDTRFHYRVRGINGCTSQPTAYSLVTSTVVSRPQPETSGSFSVSIPAGTNQTFQQDLLVPGFGDTATPGDTFSIVIDVPWITVFPASGALSAGGTTVQLTINPAPLDIGTTTATILITRTQPSSGRVSGQGQTTSTLPFSLSLVTPVTPTPRDGNAPPGTMIIPAVAHADGIGTRFQSDVRIVNVSNDEIEYDISFTPSGQNGAQTGKQTTLKIGANDVKSFDDIVKAWYGSGVLGELGIGTIEIRPLNGANPLATFASSRTYAIEQRGTYGQFIPAIPLEKFIGNLGSDALAKISLQQVSNSAAYRTNVGFAEGTGSGATIVAKLFDASNNLLGSVQRTLPPFGHEQLPLSSLFGNIPLSDGRVEVSVVSETGRATAYASVVDNATSDPLLVFPEQALRTAAKRYVVPGVAEFDNGPASNFHSDMRIFNAGSSPVTITLHYQPQTGDPTAPPAPVQRTIDPGKVTAIDNVLPALWNLSRTGGSVRIETPSDASLVVTARTFSRDEQNGTYGQFIPGVTTAQAAGAGERALEVLQLEQSDQFRTNLGLVEVNGQSARVEITAYKPDSKFSTAIAYDMKPNEFIQFGRIFSSMGLGTVYGGRVAVRVLEGSGRVAAYGSVVDNRTVDPTYVPAQ